MFRLFMFLFSTLNKMYCQMLLSIPFANSIAIQKLSNGMQRKVKAIYIRVPEFDFEAVEQVYTLV